MGFLTSLYNYLLVSAPYLLVGLFVAGIIHEFVPMEKVKKWLGGKGIGPVFKSAAVGVPLPLCSCSVIPTAVTLKKSGASNGATSSFLIATPESGIDSIAMTYGIMDLPMTIIRPIAAFASALVAGILQTLFNKEEHFTEEVEEKKTCCGSNKKVEKSFSEKVKNGVKYGFGKLLRDIALWLTIGLIAGAAIDWLVPENFFDGLGPYWGRFAILGIGIPLYICASASTPIAASLVLKGMTPGTALLFLLVGPATNVSNLAVLQKYIGKKGVIINIFAIAIVGLVFSFLTDYMYFFVEQNFKFEMMMGHEHEGATWWKIAAIPVFLIFLLKALYDEEIAPRLKKEKSSCGHGH